MKLTGLILVGCACAFAQAPSFDYDRTIPLDIQQKTYEIRGKVRIFDISFRNLAGGRTTAYLVSPPGGGKTAGALFVHWYEGGSPTSNRTQYLNEAVALAEHGLTSLLVETPWSVGDWYPKRDVSRDYENSVLEVKELRRDMDVLLSQPRVDKTRVAYVGHDFGMMYGIVSTAVDGRATVGAFQAGAPTFGEWFLYNQAKLSPEEKQKVVDRVEPLAPIRYIGELKIPILLQFANKDFYVPLEKAHALVAAANEPKQVLYYEAEHGLNQQASVDRQAFLREKLKLR